MSDGRGAGASDGYHSSGAAYVLTSPPRAFVFSTCFTCLWRICFPPTHTPHPADEAAVCNANTMCLFAQWQSKKGKNRSCRKEVLRVPGCGCMFYFAGLVMNISLSTIGAIWHRVPAALADVNFCLAADKHIGFRTCPDCARGGGSQSLNTTRWGGWVMTDGWQVHPLPPVV